MGQVAIDGIVVTLTDNSENADSYYWNYLGEIVENSDFVKELEENGDYVVTLFTENECGTSETDVEFNLDVYPEIALNAGQLEICEGESITYQSNSSNVTTYEWSFEGGSPSMSG